MSSFSGSPKLLKGGLVVLDAASGATKRTIALQYNPDSLTRSYQVQGAGGDGAGERAQPFRLKGPAIESIKLAACHEGLLLDPVYTGKVMAGTIRRARSMGRGKNLVFLHTGGGPGIFGYEPVLTNAMLGS